MLLLEARVDWHGEEALPQLSASIPPGVALPFWGSCTLGWGKALATVAALSSIKEMLFLVPLGVLVKGEQPIFFLEDMTLIGLTLLNILMSNEEPTSGHRDVCLVGTPGGASWVKDRQIDCKTTFSPQVDESFCLAKGPYFSSRGWWFGCSILVRPGIGFQVLGVVGLVVYRLSLSMLVVGLQMGTQHCLPVLSPW